MSEQRAAELREKARKATRRAIIWGATSAASFGFSLGWFLRGLLGA